MNVSNYKTVVSLQSLVCKRKQFRVTVFFQVQVLKTGLVRFLSSYPEVFKIAIAKTTPKTDGSKKEAQGSSKVKAKHDHKQQRADMTFFPGGLLVVHHMVHHEILEAHTTSTSTFRHTSTEKAERSTPAASATLYYEKKGRLHSKPPPLSAHTARL